ncbi:hypothetical protein V501_03561 [Pseudogymnoascus sp. VKM F-4519 (FW-2642)]|nr:hypothetical protein V501_03561 [Pseudogymnoascus sp. VKM F-4519 (FW-2642)]
MNDPQDPLFDGGIELLNTDPQATTQAAELSNTDTGAIIHIIELSDTDSEATIRASSHDYQKSVRITPPSDTPATAQPTETIRVAAFYTETPPSSPPNPVITQQPVPHLILTIRTSTPPPTPPINPSDIVLPPIYDADARARVYSRMERTLARIKEKLYTRVVQNTAVVTWNQQARYAKVWMCTLGVYLLAGVALVILAGVQFWKANKAR